NVNLLTSHAASSIVLRRFPEALRKLDQVLNIIPDDVDTLAQKAAYCTSRGRPAACFSASRSAPPKRRGHHRLRNTSLPGDPGAPPCTHHPSPKENTCQARPRDESFQWPTAHSVRLRARGRGRPCGGPGTVAPG